MALMMCLVSLSTISKATVIYHNNYSTIYPYIQGANYQFDFDNDSQIDFSIGIDQMNTHVITFRSLNLTGVDCGGSHGSTNWVNDTLNYSIVSSSLPSQWTVTAPYISTSGASHIPFYNHKQAFRLKKTGGYLYGYFNYYFASNYNIIIYDWYYEDQFNVSIFPNQLPCPTNPIVNIIATNTAICNGDSIALIATGANSYTWDNNITNSLYFTPTATTYYEVIGTDLNGCSDTVSQLIIVKQLTGITNSYIISPGQSISVGSSMYDTAGTFTDIFVNSQGCDSIVTTNITIDLSLGLSNSTIYSPTTYPNPITEQLTIISHGDNTYSMYDLLGNLVCFGDFRGKVKINTTYFSEGTYLLRVNNVTSLIIKQ